MFKNIGKKEEYNEQVQYVNAHYRIMWNKHPLIIYDYEDIPKDAPMDYEPKVIGQHEDDVFMSWMQHDFDHEPSQEEINQLISNINP